MKNADAITQKSQCCGNTKGSIESATQKSLGTGTLTKREVFAMAALQGLSGAHNHDGEWSHDSKLVAEVAVKYADALLEELERTSCN